MKKIIAFLMALALLVGGLLACNRPEQGGQQTDEVAEVSRGEWISMLSAEFGMDNYQSDAPYYSDVSQANDLFSYVQSCREWGVLKQTEGAFKQAEGATLGFVVSTAVYAVGADLSSYSGEDEEKSYRFAEEAGMVPVGIDYSAFATKAQCDYILDGAKDVYLKQSVTPVDRVVLDENVQSSDGIRWIAETEYLFEGLKPEVGQIYSVPSTPEYPQGTAIKVGSVRENEDGTFSVSTTQPELEEVIEELEFAGTVAPKFEDIIPGEGMTISRLAKQDKQQVIFAKVITSGSQKPMIQGTTTSADDHSSDSLSFEVSVNFTKGTVELESGWGNSKLQLESLLSGIGNASPDLGEFFEKTSVFPDKTLFGPDKYSNEEAIQAYKNGLIDVDTLKAELVKSQDKDGKENTPNITSKFKGGYEILGKLAIENLYVTVQYDLERGFLGVPVGIKSLTLETNYSVTASLSVKGKLTEELKICTVPIPLGWGVSLDLSVILYAEANGELAVKVELTDNTRVEYSGGNARKTNARSADFSATGTISISAGPGIKAELKVIGISLLDAKLTGTFLLEAKGEISLGTEWTETEETISIDRKTSMKFGIKGYFPVIKLEIGTSKDSLANKIGLTFKWDILKKEDAPLKLNIYEKEVVIWEDHQELPRNEETVSTEEESASTVEQLVEILKISEFSLHLMKGETATITAEYPSGYKAEDFVWVSGDSSVATVSGGTVKAIGEGSTIVRLASKDGLYSAECAVSVSVSEE